MITLERVRLVNWHYFRDDVIAFGNFSLLSGDNASGKSTIIDAIQFVMASDLRKVRFNAAAGDRRSGRDLAGYVRCKLGSDSTDYLRGDAVGHVMLEFSDGGCSFTAGACVEAWKDGRIATRFWIGDDRPVANVAVLSETGAPLLARQFQDSLSGGGVTFYDSSSGFRRDFTARLGVWRRMSENNPYIEAFVRSLHFTPLVSVDQFVCDYILDEQTIDLSAMKHNLESYREAEDIARSTRDRIASLSSAIEAGEECVGLERIVLQQDWLKLYLDADRAAKGLKDAQGESALLALRAEEIKRDKATVEARKLALEGEYRETSAALARDDVHQLYRSLSERIEGLERAERETARQVERRDLLIGQCSPMFAGLFPGESLDSSGAAGAAERVDAERERLDRALGRLASGRDAVRERLSAARSELAELDRGERRLPESPRLLREALRKEGIDAWILCELAEVSDPSWSDAVEGWLNTLRFACIVAEGDFPRALRAYDALPRSVAGVPLPDIGRLARDAEANPARNGSLARLVGTDNAWARTYLDATLGDVMQADLSTLRRHSRAITKECMSWSRHTATRVKEDVYRVAWLGESARVKRRESLVADIENLASCDARAASDVARSEEAISLCKALARSLAEAMNLEPAVAELARLKTDIAETRARLEEIDTSAFRGLEERLREISSMVDGAARELELVHVESGSVDARREGAERRIESLAAELSERERAFAAFRADRVEAETDCERYVAERLKAQSADEILANFDKSRQGWITRLETAEKAFRARIAKHNNAFSEMLSAERDDLPAIRHLKKRLEDSELPDYLEKIRRARVDAEREFKDHFIARLNELIEGAKDSFSEINSTLRSLTFGRDQYRFTLTERTERRGQIDVIRKTADIADVEEGLFASLVDEADRDAANELFSRILNSSLESAELRSLCDYRTYFTYDIRVRDAQSIDPATGKNPEYSLSRVLKEKSGGEAQTPYYVAIAASFFRFFREKPDATVRLVVFDEAFDRLDDERIAKILAFYRDLGLQIIVAVPSEKLESIAPHMDAINLVVRHGQLAKTVAFRDYSRDGEASRDAEASQ